MFYLFGGAFICMMLVVFAGKVVAGPKREAAYDRAVLGTFRWVFIVCLILVVGIVAWLMLFASRG